MGETISPKPTFGEHQTTPINLEALIRDYAADVLAAIEQHAPTPYTKADMDREPYEEERMRGYNDAIEEFWIAIRGVFGYHEPDEQEPTG